MQNSIKEAYQQRGFQGAPPDKARIIFWGTDANFDPNLSDEQSNLVLQYLQDGPAFWRKHGVHHPFLKTKYDFHLGTLYHKKFHKLNFDMRDADIISFVDIYGYSESSTLSRHINRSTRHLSRHLGECFSGGKINCIPPSVLKEFKKFLKHTGPELPTAGVIKGAVDCVNKFKAENRDQIPVFDFGSFYVVRHFHFSHTELTDDRIGKLKYVLLNLLGREPSGENAAASCFVY